jgi:hypothetical protein
MRLQDFWFLCISLSCCISCVDLTQKRNNLELFNKNFEIEDREPSTPSEKEKSVKSSFMDNNGDDLLGDDNHLNVIGISDSQYILPEFDWKLANTSVWLCASAYCPSDSLLSREYTGPSKGFVPTDVIKTEQYDIDGFVGYLSSQRRIFVVFRGTSTEHDLEGDLDTTLVNYPYCNNCKVHEGFYKAELSILSSLFKIVSRLLKWFPAYEVVVSGHSLGGALATLIAMDLVHKFLDDMDIGDTPFILPSSSTDSSSVGKLRVTLVNFGSPKIGNIELAVYASSLLLPLHYRVTHLRDIVPHLPLFMGYTQINGEYYENEDGVVIACNGFEDLGCSSQWFILSIEDHFLYLGVPMSCVTVSKVYHPHIILRE